LKKQRREIRAGLGTIEGLLGAPIFRCEYQNGDLLSILAIFYRHTVVGPPGKKALFRKKKEGGILCAFSGLLVVK